MKKTLLILAALIFTVSLNSQAEDFSAVNDGDTIYYKITSSVAPYRVAVTHKSSNYYYFREYSDSVSIPDSVLYNGNYYKVNAIGYLAFGDCIGLTSITLPNSLDSIGTKAFVNCTGLTSITIPNSVTLICEAAFESCKGLSSITIPNSVTHISTNAFFNCLHLYSITIPSSVSRIGSNAFYGTPYYNNKPDGLIYINNILYKYKGIMPENTSISVQNGTTIISARAFENYDSLISITIPNTVTMIDDRAFFMCDGLTSITIPNSLTTIGIDAFYHCSGLTSVILGNSVNFINMGGFRACTGLTSITSLAINPPTIVSITFLDDNKNIPVYVPLSSVASYQSAPFWNEFTNFIGRDFQYIDATICDGDSYNFNGTTLDSAGVYYNDSIVLTLNVNPSPIIPLDLNAQVISDYIELTWQGDSSSTYVIYRNEDSLTTTTTPMYLDYDVILGQPYCYKIKSINSSSCESEFSDTICKTYLGLEDISLSNIQTKLYPNPTNGKSYLGIEGLTSETDVLVYDVVGRIIQSYKINQDTKELEIDLSTYAKGVYSIRIVNESINQSKKLVVQ
ncbi:MAG: leucine-rich repeat protein [Bacteroidales bacterium]|nr:leucine-rich repeat protein [Bacteroidales bacterium]